LRSSRLGRGLQGAVRQQVFVKNTNAPARAGLPDNLSKQHPPTPPPPRHTTHQVLPGGWQPPQPHTGQRAVHGAVSRSGGAGHLPARVQASLLVLINRHEGRIGFWCNTLLIQKNAEQRHVNAAKCDSCATDATDCSEPHRNNTRNLCTCNTLTTHSRTSAGRIRFAHDSVTYSAALLWAHNA